MDDDVHLRTLWQTGEQSETEQRRNWGQEVDRSFKGMPSVTYFLRVDSISGFLSPPS